MRRHLSWIVPLLVLPLIYVVFTAIVWWASTFAEEGQAETLWGLLTVIVALLTAVAGAIVCVVLVIRNAHRVFRAWRRSNGHFTKRELIAREQQSTTQSAWEAAQRLLADVRAERLPNPITVWGVIPNHDETFFYDVDARYERFYGTTESYAQHTGLFVGRPAFVLAGVAATAIANSASHSAAANRAATQWREAQHSRILVSNQRLVIQANGQWLSFYLSGMTACYPSPEAWSVAFEFGDTSPLRLTGRGAPLVAVWTVLARQGREAVHAHPGLAPLR